jgi:hypothetical protein
VAQPFATACNSFSKFKAAREWLANNGGAGAVLVALRADGFVEADGESLTLAGAYTRPLFSSS